jgi:hypothetical protein
MFRVEDLGKCQVEPASSPTLLGFRFSVFEFRFFGFGYRGFGFRVVDAARGRRGWRGGVRVLLPFWSRNPAIRSKHSTIRSRLRSPTFYALRSPNFYVATRPDLSPPKTPKWTQSTLNTQPESTYSAAHAQQARRRSPRRARIPGPYTLVSTNCRHKGLLETCIDSDEEDIRPYWGYVQADTRPYWGYRVKNRGD